MFFANKGSISISIAADEETTGLGTPTIIKYLKRRSEKIDFSIIAEPSSNKSVGDEIRIGRRGSMNGIINVYGKSGHSAFANSYINPFYISTISSLCITSDFET